MCLNRLVWIYGCSHTYNVALEYKHVALSMIWTFKKKSEKNLHFPAKYCVVQAVNFVSEINFLCLLTCGERMPE